MARPRLATVLVGVLASCLLFAGALAGDESVLNSEIGRLNNQSLFWGPYRPNLYFGVRQRQPNSLVTGLMWSNMDDYQAPQQNLRYTCEQHQGMAGYGWDEYDTRKGGVQTIHDAGNHVDITTSFVKVPGGAHGGSWAARIKGVPRPGAPDDVRTQVLLFLGQEGFGAMLEPSEEGDKDGYPGDVAFTGKSESLGDYKVVITKGLGEHPAGGDFSVDHDMDKTAVQSLTLPPEVLWQAQRIVQRQVGEKVTSVKDYISQDNLPPAWQVFALPHKPAVGNAQIVQKIFEGAFQFDILFSSASAGKELTSEDLTREIKETTESFGERFTSVFAPQAPFTTDEYATFGRSMLSNLIGGIGYFYGQHLVDRSYAPEYEEDDEGFWEAVAEAKARNQQKLEGPYELFSSIPSRPFFPRGFLWDEGFHLLPIADWDMDLVLEILKSWFNLMDEDGWIPREMILGEEARSKVPEEFQVQYPHFANPPTLFFVIDTFIAKLQKIANGSASSSDKEKLSQGETLGTAYLDNTSVGHDYLRQLYPLLRRQFEWFRRTQHGDIKSYDREAYSSKEAYRWRGRTPRHVLTSGMDDYPRTQPPHPAELNVDLMAWVGMMTKSLINVASAIGGADDDVAEYRKVLDAIEHNLDDLHWSDADGCYCDATIDDYEENQLVCHKGYVSLMPFLTGLLPADSPKLGRLLDLIGDEDELWSPHGIRSLSKKSEFYGTDENYWRSPVWININYMAVVQLHNVATQSGPNQAKARDLYSRLRKNLVETIYKSWRDTGFAWEQYNPETGAGQRTQHFTGWTSLVVKIMAMEDLSGTGGGHVKDEL